MAFLLFLLVILLLAFPLRFYLKIFLLWTVDLTLRGKSSLHDDAVETVHHRIQGGRKTG